MSRVLKVLINIILACALISAALLLVPSFLGIETIIIQNKRVETNLAVGSVTYGREKPVAEVKVGDSIYVENKDGSEYLYKVDAVDAGTETLIIRNASDSSAESMEVEMDKACVRIVTIPVIGYLAAMAGSLKGWIIIGLVILLLILLFVISEMWEKDVEAKEEEEGRAIREEDHMDMEGLSSRKRKKLEQKQKKQEEKAAKKAAKKNKKDQRGQDMEEPEVQRGVQPITEAESPAALFEAAREEIASSVASATTAGIEEPEAQPEIDPTIDLERQITEELARAAREPDSVQEMTEERSAEAPVSFAGDAEPVDVECQEIVIPCCSVDELLRKAILAGDEPEVLEDKELGITFLDYSEVL